jgi:phenylalanyl-tRNA synthetase beta chain
MKFTLSWLKDHLDTTASLGEITDTLTSLGLEVDGVEDPAAALAPFTIAYVKSAVQHPNADRLRVCIVDTGKGEVQVVCGAPNARTGMKGVFAPVGAHIPGTGIDLKAGVIRGEASNGMLCSEREMGLSNEHDGIIELPAEAPLGASFAAWRRLDDPVIEIGLTPDRADCAGIRGIARDLAAAGLGTLKPLDETPVAAAFQTDLTVALDFPADVAAACPLFVARVFRGVKNGPSPAWLQQKLKAIGLRPISVLVDITNFFTFDRNRPLHVFDKAKVQGGLRLRLSQGGETLVALNDKTYTLGGGVTVIADDAAVLSLGGIMGGASTGVESDTADVILEAALFDPIRTAMSGRALGVSSDARYRFERGVDPAAVFAGIEQATRLILELCGGEASQVVVAGQEPDWRRQLTLRPGRVASLGGVDVPRERQQAILSALGFGVSDGDDGLTLADVPSWRGDVQGEADLVEEVLRVNGYDAIPAVPLPRMSTLTQPALTPQQKAREVVRRSLAARGLDEAVTWSFMDGRDAALFGFANAGLKLVNPIASDLDTMRPSVLPNLIRASGRNAARGLPDAALFEIGPIYRDATETGQAMVASGTRAGQSGPRHWSQPPRPVDAFDAKADAAAALEAAGAPVANLVVSTDAPGWYHPGRSGCLRLGPTVLAQFGELHPAVLSALGVDGPVVGFEVFLDAVPQPKKKAGTAKPLLKLAAFQPVVRDFAFVVDDGVAADRITKAAKGADKALIADVALFDVYRGPGVAEGRKSLALAVTLQPVEATLTDEAIEAVSKKIVAAVEKQGGTLRG